MGFTNSTKPTFDSLGSPIRPQLMAEGQVLLAIIYIVKHWDSAKENKIDLNNLNSIKVQVVPLALGYKGRVVFMK